MVCQLRRPRPGHGHPRRIRRAVPGRLPRSSDRAAAGDHGLEPGLLDPAHQARSRLFADEIRNEYGSYSAWARSRPCDRNPWTAAHGPNTYFRSRLNFTRTWLDDAVATMNDMLIVEPYPWHSAHVTAAMQPPADVLNIFMGELLAELAVMHHFAFGRPWQAAANELGPCYPDVTGREAGQSAVEKLR